jgi:hypothetical protein
MTKRGRGRSLARATNRAEPRNITYRFDAYPDLGYTVVILNNIDSDPNSLAYRLREWIAQGTR